MLLYLYKNKKEIIMLEQLLAQWVLASEAWTESNHDLKRAKTAHDESVATKNEIENAILFELLSQDIPSVNFEDKTFSVGSMKLNSVNTELAMRIIHERGLSDRLLRENIKLTWLKEAKLDGVEGIIITEYAYTLKVNVN
jgi:hypothetical protein